jgi:hypothetical protein
LEITHLEQVFNNGNLFPKVLKEFLYLAGDYCYVMDTGSWDSIEEMNIEHRADYLNIYGVTMNRPYLFLDIVGGNGELFMFLDEGDNPELNIFQCGTCAMHSLPEAKDIARDILASNIGVMSNEKLFLSEEKLESLGN